MPAKLITEDDISIIHFDASFSDFVGSRAAFSLLISTQGTSKNPMFNHICEYNVSREELLLTSGLLATRDPSAASTVLISRVSFKRNRKDDIVEIKWAKLRPPPAMTMPASATPYRDGTLFCSRKSCLYLPFLSGDQCRLDFLFLCLLERKETVCGHRTPPPR